MLQRQSHWIRLLVPLIIFILGCPPPGPVPPDFVEESLPGETHTGFVILGSTHYLVPDSQGALMVQVQDPYSGQPQTNTRVRVVLNTPDGATQELFTGETDNNGLVQVGFAVPTALSDTDATLAFTADIPNYGQLYHEQDVYVGRVYNILLSSDKPVYQPGQMIHIRTLALDSNALKAAQDQPLVLTVADPEGNKLLRKELTTSAFGISSADFQLDTQAMSGDYLLTATMGPVTSSRTVEVKPYTLPRFAVTFQSDKSFYLPGDVATGTVDAQYFFGKPVVSARVMIKGFVTDVDRFQVFELTGTTDDSGFYPYEFQVPDYFVGQLDNETATVDLEISVIDTANHSESIDESITVAEQTILVEAVPESGFLRPGLENVIYLQSSSPDGGAIQTTLTVQAGVTETGTLSDTFTVTTDEFGLATITVTPHQQRFFPLTITATDNGGQQVVQPLILGIQGNANAVLLRPERSQYAIGDTLNLDIYVAGTATTAYLDVVKDGQTFGLAALPVADGVAQAAIDLDGSLLGTLELNAYVIASGAEGNGEIVRDRRFVLVDPAPADVTVQTNADVYRPGDTATLAITVEREGAPMPGVVGLSIVDESVFAVGAQDPGFARTYFLLERELQEPRYEIHDFTPLGDDDPSPYDKGAICTAVNSGCSTAAFAQRQGAQQMALAGFFAEELAARGPALADARVHAGDPAVVAQRAQPLVGGWSDVLAARIALIMPLVGVALYNGSRRRRNLLLGLVVLSGALFWSSCAPAAAPAADMAVGESAAMEAPAAEAMTADTTATRGSQNEPPRLRQFFPETLYWLPELQTDANGRAQVDVPIADSITTWRISVLASDQDGNLGSAQVGMRVFQDFFVEPDLPRFLTVGDELSVPVSIFNYLDEPQEITLDVAAADWFEFVDSGQGTAATLTFAVQPNEVSAAY
ncbi:MAG TPA: alpha-2-macroglobulin family protein, partial [Caldilineaceae bacterium]|nr:alpha-2-macroglobulin family protein [Caldilineaceae bacterium]